MIVDCHVHIAASTPGHGWMSPRLQNSIAFRYLRWRLQAKGYDAQTERALEQRLVETLDATPQIDAAVVLAFDAVHDLEGRLDEANTHLYVTNNFAIELAARYPKVLFGASVHPYRKDAVAEIERCVQAGAVLLKWLPIVQNFDPSDDRCIPVYEALAHHNLPLLSHTGGEKSLPTLNEHVADPMLLEPALKLGVTVIAAHCGTRSTPFETDFVPNFMYLAREYENCYGDTAALNIPPRWYAWNSVLRDPVVHRKLVHGSDWPIPAYPPLGQINLGAAAGLLREPNWLRRDVLIKQMLGLDEAYWHRGATLLRGCGKAARTSA